jgi:methyltransferase (TIGR00027 family)
MSDRPASRTAWGVMVLRAVHQLIDDEPRILDDYVAPRLLDAETLQGIRDHPGHFRNAPSRALRAHVVIRSRYAEDRMAEAIWRGVTQCVILGAGYDTFAYRQPVWGLALRIFEVDHPATQQAKRESLQRSGIEVPDNVTFVPIDFERETLADGLRRHGFDFTVPTFVSCLGVLVYLTAEAVESVFRFAASLPPASEIVCTFRKRSTDDQPESPLAAAVAAAGEPWLSQFNPIELRDALRKMAFGEVTLISGAELEVRYALQRADGVQPSRKMMMLSAVK